MVDIRRYGHLYAGHGFGGTGILPCQFSWSLRNECFGTLVAGGTPAETFIRLPFKARPRRLVFHADYGFHDGRNGNLSPSAPIDGRSGNASAGFCFIGMDRLENGGQYVCRVAACLARPMGKHKGATEAERQANPSEDKCRKPIGGILAGYPGDESLQSVGRPFRPAAQCLLPNFAVPASVRKPC